MREACRVPLIWLCYFCPQDPTASLETLLKALPDGSAPKATYVKGDKVEVIAGDLTSLTGKAAGAWCPVAVRSCCCQTLVRCGGNSAHQGTCLDVGKAPCCETLVHAVAGLVCTFAARRWYTAA